MARERTGTSPLKMKPLTFDLVPGGGGGGGDLWVVFQWLALHAQASACTMDRVRNAQGATDRAEPGSAASNLLPPDFSGLKV